MEIESNSKENPITIILQSDGVVTGSNKSRINGHIATQSHRLRRNREEKAREAHGRRKLLDPTNHLCPGKRSKHRNASCNYFSLYDTSSGLKLSTSSILQKGNSDPFSATAVEIDLEVSQLLTFTRDCLLPSLHGVDSSFSKGPMLMNMWWQDVLDGLNAGSVGYGYLSRSAAIMTTITNSPQTRKTALAFRDKASAALRTELVQAGVSFRKTLCWSIFALFSAEIASHNFLAAQVHGQMLRKFLQPELGQNLAKVDMEERFLMAVLLQDITRATLSLSRPLFDLHRWTKENLPGTILDDVHIQGPSFFPMEKKLDASLSLRMCFIFTGIRQWLLVLGMIIANPKIYTQTLLVNGAMRLLTLEGHLINHYLDSMELLPDDFHSGRNNFARIKLLEEACISLAAIYWLRRVAHERMGAGSKLSQAGSNAYDTGPITLKKMEVTYRHLEDCDMAQSSPALRLWILYVGAVAEQANEKTDPTNRYFNMRFVALAAQMGFVSWERVEIVLKPFLYLDRFGLMARHWFTHAMQTAVHIEIDILKQEAKSPCDGHMKSSLE